MRILLCAKWIKSWPNPVDISTAWKNLKSFLSFIDKMQWAKNPSQATVPLRGTLSQDEYFVWRPIKLIQYSTGFSIFRLPCEIEKYYKSFLSSLKTLTNSKIVLNFWNPHLNSCSGFISLSLVNFLWVYVIASFRNNFQNQRRLS